MGGFPTESYTVVFDASQNGGQLAVWIVGPIVAVILGSIAWVLGQSENVHERDQGHNFGVFSVIALLVSLVGFSVTAAEYYRAVRALRNHECRVAEGEVADFVPTDLGGHTIEKFRVGDRCFEYGSAKGLIVFDSRSNHGYIHDGVHVRITYKDSDILRIEVK
jgi:hypothetical protein